MKKIIFLSYLFLIYSIMPAHSACDGGNWISGSSGEFCVSKTDMLNWWTAYNWCKANDLNLATIYEMCPSWDGLSGTGKCPELKGISSDFVWASTSFNHKFSFIINLKDGGILLQPHNSDSKETRYRTYSGSKAICH